MNPEISIFVSCYNEQETIVVTVETLIFALLKLVISWEILIIDDCSMDNSVAVIQQFMHENSAAAVYLHKNEVNQGLGANVFTAARLAKGRYFWFVGGDNPVPKEACYALISQIGKADIIVPNVMYYENRTLFRRILSWTYAFLVRIVSGSSIRYFNFSSIYLREQFVAQMEKISGFTYSAELIIYLLDQGCSYLEVPVIYTDRTCGKSTAVSILNFIDVIGFLSRLLRRRWNLMRARAAKIRS